MTTYETPQVVASYSIDELIEEAAVCTVTTGRSRSRSSRNGSGGSPQRAAPEQA